MHVVILRNQSSVEIARSSQESRDLMVLSTNFYLTVCDMSSLDMISSCRLFLLTRDKSYVSNFYRWYDTKLLVELYWGTAYID